MRYKFFQYPRGVNKGGVLNTEICPTISTSSWENNCFLIEIEECDSTEVKTDDSLAVMEESILIPEATAKGYAEATDGDSVNLEQPNSKTRRGRVGKQMANTLTTSCNQGVVVSEPKIIEVGFVKDGKHQQDYVQHEDGICRTICTGTHASTPHLLKTMISVDTDTTICLNSKVDGKQPSLEHRIYDSSGISTAITTGFHPSVATPKYRIRKLTPRECFRLMDVDENVIDTIQAAGISNSQQYKLAGNSIVVACLEKIFEQMFFPQYTNSRTLFG
jgi:DNA (cytosine-5)-methyltransferase 1